MMRGMMRLNRKFFFGQFLFIVLIVTSSLFTDIRAVNESDLPTRKKQQEPTDIVDKILDADYDKHFRPQYGGKPVEVGVTLSLLSVPEIDTVAMTMTVKVYLLQTWMDDRLAFEGNETTIILDGNRGDKVWVPDTFFEYEIRSYEHEVTVPNKFIKITNNGQVSKGSDYTVEVSCPMNMKYFPFDDQVCALVLAFFGHDSSDFRFKWAKGNQSFELNKEVSLPEYQIEGHKALAIGSNHSTLAAAIWFSRSSGRYLIEFFLPAILLTCVSLGSLLVRDAKTAILINLFSVGITILFLTMSSGSLEFPRISYATSMDIFSGITYAFIILSLLATTLIFYLSKGRMSAESIELRNVDESTFANSSRRLVDVEDEENFSTRHSNGLRSGSNFWTINKVIEDGILSCLPIVKLVLITAYLLANLTYWSIHPWVGRELKDTNVYDRFSQDWNIL